MASDLTNAERSTDTITPEPLQGRDDDSMVTRWAPGKAGLVTMFALASLLLVLLCAGMCYAPVCVNAFLSDDYLHVTWLRDAAQHPQLLWRNFYSCWLDGDAAKFYRPLISVFMFTDYKLWGVDARGFHLTNILFHLCGSAFLFGIGCELAKLLRPNVNQVNGDLHTLSPRPFNAHRFLDDYGLALSGAALFALYPLHPEAVSWITGRVDCIVTAFFLGSIWCYMRWQAVAKTRMLCLSLVLFALSLMSKEMAVVLPATLTSLELFTGSSAWSARAKRVAPFWLMLAGYFVVRKLALGTFVGGYDDSLALSNTALIAQNWKHGIMKVFAPINTELIDRHNFAFQVWQKTWRPVIAISIIAAITNKRRAGVYAFLLSWFVVALVPVYKIFWISDNLEGSRLAYLATAPLCLAMGFAIFSWRYTFPRLKWVLPTVQVSFAMLICWSAAYLLVNNNKAWASAGHQMESIHNGLRTIYANIKGDPDVILMGLPDTYSGAYIARNAISGMTRAPLLDRDINNAVVIDRYEPIYPFGARKNYLASHHDTAHVYRWDEKASRFDETPVPAFESSPAMSRMYSSISLKRVIEPVSQPGVISKWNPDGSLTLTSEPAVRPQVVLQDKGIEPFDVNYLQVKLRGKQPGHADDGLDVLYTTDFSPSFRLDKRIHQSLNSAETTVLIGVHSYPEWAFAKHPASLAFVFPSGWSGVIYEVGILPAAMVTPALTLPAPPMVAAQGVVHVGGRSGSAKATIDASSIPGAASTELEISRCNVSFEDQNSPAHSKTSWRSLPFLTRGQWQIDPNYFPSTGVYQARAWAKNAEGRDIGLCSDHINVVVDGKVK